MKREEGVGAVVVILLILTIGLVGVGGWYAVGKDAKDPTESQRFTAQDEVAEAEEPASTTTGNEQPVEDVKKDEPQEMRAGEDGSKVTEAAEYVYNISANGELARVSPTRMSFPGADNVKVKVMLNCEAECKFRLKSDQQDIEDSTIYTESGTIEYLVTQPGQHTLSN